ncbi:MAG: ATP-binding protein [Sandaracinaceae bacterium]
MSTTSSGELTRRFAVQAGGIVSPPHESGSPRLVVLMGSEAGRRYSLTSDHIVVGRSEDCDVQIDDGKVSRRHAVISQGAGNRWTIEDLGSRNGTIVNGRAVSTENLALGDRIQLSGETLLLFTRQDPLEDLLLHRQQMEVIGQLAAGIAHDFNNLLNVITASVAHLDGLPADTPLETAEVVECRADISAAAKRAGELTGRLLGIARRREERGGQEMVDFSELCHGVLSLVRRTFDRSIAVHSKVDDGLVVSGDHAALHQLIMNLVINARDAMPDGGELTLHAWAADEDTGQQLVLRVADTGVGMDEATRQRVFEPFFTTKAQGAGSGLGLATVYEVATNHGGLVEVESELGVGSTFRVRLRAESARPEKKQRRKARMQTWTDKQDKRADTGHVLVVDDQELVRRSVGRLVRAAGHTVTYATDGQEAFEMYRDADPRPDVVLLDLDMPRMSGSEALVAIRELDPNARVVLLSGYYDDARKRRLLELGATDFLAKPLDAEVFRRSIRLAMRMPDMA